MHRIILPLSIAAATSLAAAQTTVSYATTAWTDFGNTDVAGVSGNFLPGWTTISATPDLGDDLFSLPNQSLSGVNDDAALWFNHWKEGTTSAGANEIARLSLSGFTPGQIYSLDFSATLVWYAAAGWAGNNDWLDVSLTGASITDWNSSVLTDAGDSDGLNTWVAQSLVFTAVSGTVEFDFGGGAAGPAPISVATRFGIDGIGVRPVPAPGALALLTGGALLAARRKR